MGRLSTSSSWRIPSRLAQPFESPGPGRFTAIQRGWNSSFDLRARGQAVARVQRGNDHSTIASDSRFTGKARQSAAPRSSGVCAGSSLRNTRCPKIWERLKPCSLRQMHWSSTGKNEIATSSIPKHRPIPSCNRFVLPTRGVIFRRVSYATPAPGERPCLIPPSLRTA